MYDIITYSKPDLCNPERQNTMGFPSLTNKRRYDKNPEISRDLQKGADFHRKTQKFTDSQQLIGKYVTPRFRVITLL